MPAKALLLRLASLLVGVVLALGIAESLLRGIGYSGERERSDRVFDPKWGTVPKDSWIFDFEVDPERQTTVTIRDQIVPIRKEPGETRIVFIGDSGTEGSFVPPHQSFPFQFERLLDKKRPDNQVRVINAGVFGMTTIDEYHFLKDKLLPLEPEIVILGLFMSNDINFNLGHGEWRIDRKGPPVVIEALRTRSALAHFLYLKALLLNDRYKLFRVADPGEESPIPVELGLIDSYGFHMLSYPAGEVATYMKESSRLIDHAFEVLREVFQQFQLLASQHDFEMQVILLPSPSSVLGRLTLQHFPDIIGDLHRQGVEVEESEMDFMKPTRRVLEICDALDLICIDPTQRLRWFGLRAFLRKDEHLSGIGHEALARELLAHYLGGP